MAHTPAPWKTLVTARRILVHQKTDEIDGGYFCEVIPLHSTVEALAICHANAKLIAAAPDLLAALRGAVHAMAVAQQDAINIGGLKSEEGKFFDEYLAAARAAIAKATE